jgi:hypothetical protein
VTFVIDRSRWCNATFAALKLRFLRLFPRAWRNGHKLTTGAAKLLVMHACVAGCPKLGWRFHLGMLVFFMPIVNSNWLGWFQLRTKVNLTTLTYPLCQPNPLAKCIPLNYFFLKNQRENYLIKAECIIMLHTTLRKNKIIFKRIFKVVVFLWTVHLTRSNGGIPGSIMNSY